MQAYSVEKAIILDGKIQLDTLPFDFVSDVGAIFRCYLFHGFIAASTAASKDFHFESGLPVKSFHLNCHRH